MAPPSVTWQIKTEMRPELEIILHCGRLQLDSGTIDHIRALLRGHLNWSEVVANAIRHRVTPTVYEVLVEIGPELIPPSWQQSLRQIAQVSAKNSLMLLQEM